MADREMPLLNAPAEFFKKYTIQLPTRVLTGVASLGNITFDHTTKTHTISRDTQAKDTVCVKFSSDSIRDLDEAAVILGLVRQAHVRTVSLRIAANDLVMQIRLNNVGKFSPGDIRGQFQALCVVCSRDAMKDNCLNADQQITTPNVQSVVYGGLIVASVFALFASLVLIRPVIAAWILAGCVVMILGSVVFELVRETMRLVRRTTSPASAAAGAQPPSTGPTVGSAVSDLLFK